MTLEELRAKRQASLAAAQAICDKAKNENRDVTDEELAEIETHKNEASQLRDKIEASEKRQRVAAQLAAEAAWGRQAQEPIPAQQHTQDTTARVVEQPFASFGDYLNRVRAAATDPRATGELERRILATASGFNTNVGSEGGFLIPPDYATEIQSRMYEQGQILSRVKRIPLTGNTYKLPYVAETSRANGSRWGGVRGYWAEQGGTVTATKPAFGLLSLELKKAMCLGYVTEEQQQDYAATGDLLLQAFSEEITYMVEDAIIRGTGAGQPLGILAAACLVTQDAETNQTADTIWGPNVAKMFARFWARSRLNPSAAWFINQDCEAQLMGLMLEGRYASAATSAEGVPIYLPAGSFLNSGQYAKLLGLPVIPIEQADTVGNVGDIMLTDFSQYILADKGGPAIAESMHVRFLYDEQTFRVTYRVDGAPWWASALTPANSSNTLSPFVALAARA